MISFEVGISAKSKADKQKSMETHVKPKMTEPEAISDQITSQNLAIKGKPMEPEWTQLTPQEIEKIRSHLKFLLVLDKLYETEKNLVSSIPLYIRELLKAEDSEDTKIMESWMAGLLTLIDNAAMEFAKNEVHQRHFEMSIYFEMVVNGLIIKLKDLEQTGDSMKEPERIGDSLSKMVVRSGQFRDFGQRLLEMERKDRVLSWITGYEERRFGRMRITVEEVEVMAGLGGLRFEGRSAFEWLKEVTVADMDRATSSAAQST